MKTIIPEPATILLNGERILFAWTVTDENLENPVSHHVRLEKGFDGCIFERDFKNFDREVREALAERVEWTMQELMAGRLTFRCPEGDFEYPEVVLAD